MWYCAHVVFYYRYEDGNQNDFVGHENMVLIDATSPREAHQKAVALARSEENGHRRPSTVNGRDAKYVFGGIRMVVKCLGQTSTDVVNFASGDEASYITFVIDNEKEFKNYVGGKEATITLEEVPQKEE
jgi:hypothetical protein